VTGLSVWGCFILIYVILSEFRASTFLLISISCRMSFCILKPFLKGNGNCKIIPVISGLKFIFLIN
jgi:hypothetical protein